MVYTKQSSNKKFINIGVMTILAEQLNLNENYIKTNI